MKTNSIKILVGQIISFLYILVVGYILYISHRSPGDFMVAVFVSIVVGLMLWFFYRWTVKYF